MTSPSRSADTLLKRGARVRPLGSADMAWLWAAYQMGGYKEILPTGLGDDAFTDTVLDLIEQMDMAWIIDAPNAKGMQPVGLVLGRFFSGGRALEPHVDWFPWATARNKLEGAAQFLRQVSRQYKIFLFIREEELPFYERVCKYRVMTRGCKINDHFAPGRWAMMFYTVGI